MSVKLERIYWWGNEDEQFKARIKACRARRKQYKGSTDCDKDGSCQECEHDMAMELRISKKEYDKRVKELGYDPR